MRTIVHRHFLSLRESFVVAIWCLSIHTAFGQGDASTWKKHTINDQSPFEAAGASDFNGDGRMDVFSGDSWYAAPDWTRHKVREVPRGTNPHYHEDFADQPLDVNGDGRIDIITPTGWFEQPVKRDDAWTL